MCRCCTCKGRHGCQGWELGVASWLQVTFADLSTCFTSLMFNNSIVLHQIMCLLGKFVSSLSSFLRNFLAFVYLQWEYQRFRHKTFWSWDGICIHCLGQEVQLENHFYDFASIFHLILLQHTFKLSQLSLVYPHAAMQNTCLFPNRKKPAWDPECVWVDAHIPLFESSPNLVTRVQQYLQMPMWLLMLLLERCQAASWVHSRDLKKCCHPWATQGSKRTMFERVFDARCCRIFPILVPKKQSRKH